MGNNLPQNVIISISDTGLGIPADRINKIFDRFYQASNSEIRPQEGTGIGLALTKELVELHHGSIDVKSELNKGTTFSIYLPLGKEHFESEDFIPELVQEEVSSIDEFEINEEDQEPKPDLVFPVRKKPLVLIVEDNAEMRSYLCEHLAEDYEIIEGQDGLVGFEKTIETIPDLIISDVMMPGLDGFELCDKVKNDERVSHIPFILLTSRAAMDDKIEGLETGADDYIPKPFDANELKARIKNLIAQRARLKERFSREAVFSIDKMDLTSTDEKFLSRAITIIENEMSNPDLDVDNFAEAMAISRAHLYTKLQALIGQSVKQFIRTIRLKYAAQLLQKHTGNISEIAYQVGFNNPAYFSECFHKQFGQSPSEFASNN